MIIKQENYIAVVERSNNVIRYIFELDNGLTMCVVDDTSKDKRDIDLSCWYGHRETGYEQALYSQNDKLHVKVIKGRNLKLYRLECVGEEDLSDEEFEDYYFED